MDVAPRERAPSKGAVSRWTITRASACGVLGLGLAWLVSIGGRTDTPARAAGVSAERTGETRGALEIGSLALVVAFGMLRSVGRGSAGRRATQLELEELRAERERLVADERQATVAASRSGERFRRLFESSLDGIVMLDDAGRFQDVNEAACAMLGHGRDRMLELGLADLRTIDGPAVTELFADYRAGARATGELEVVREAGDHRVLEYTATSIDEHLHLVILRDVTERRRAEHRSRVLLEIAQDIGGSLERTEILQRVQRRVAAALPCDAMVAWYWDPESEVYRMISHHGIPAELAAAAESIVFRANEPFEGRLERETVVLNDMTAQSWIPPEMYGPFRIAALMNASFRSRGRHVGSLGAIRSTPGRPFTPEEADLFTAVTSELSVAIEAAELYRLQLDVAELSAMRARFSQELIESLKGDDFLDRMCGVAVEILEADASHFVAFRPDRDDFVSLASYGTGPDDRERAVAIEIPRAAMAPILDAFEKDDVVHVEAAPPGLGPNQARDPLGLTTQLCIALRRGPQLVGVMAIHRRGRTVPFTMRQKVLARSIAHVASLALEHARVVAELARSSDMNTELFGVFSHEVRTPLNVIVGYQDLLLDGAFGPLEREQEDVLRRAQSSALALAHLIQNSLDLSRLGNGRMTVDLEETSIALLLGALEAETALLRETSGVPLELELDPRLVSIRTDSAKVHAVLSNVLVNAFQHTASGRVSVAARPLDGGIEIAVTDTGTGIPHAALDKLFEPLQRIDGEPSGAHRGVGLGLHVAHRMLAMIGGTISATSVVGRGSCFRIWVPDDAHDRGDAAPVLTRVVRQMPRAFAPPSAT